MSASLSRFGGVRAQSHLRQILLCLGANVLNDPEVFISNADETIDSKITKTQLIKIVNIINNLNEK
jgi:NAD(P)H-dependent FMN reductase